MKLRLAQQDYAAHTRSIDLLEAKDPQSHANLKPSVDSLKSELEAAEKAISEATDFEDTVAQIGIFSLCCLALGTVLQVLAV